MKHVNIRLVFVSSSNDDKARWEIVEYLKQQSDKDRELYCAAGCSEKYLHWKNDIRFKPCFRKNELAMCGHFVNFKACQDL